MIEINSLTSMLILIIIIAIIVAIFFSSKHRYQMKDQHKVHHGRMHFMFTDRVRYRQFKLSGVDMNFWKADEHSNVTNPAAYNELVNEFSFSHDDLKYLSNPQIKELSRCLVLFPNASYNAVYNSQQIDKFRHLQTELTRFKKVINQRRSDNQLQENYFNKKREQQIIAIKKQYKLNKQNLSTLNDQEKQNINEYVNTYLHLINKVDYTPNSIMVLDSIKQQLDSLTKSMTERVAQKKQTEGLR